MKTRAVLRISGQLLTSLLIALKEGEEPRSFRVVEHGLPDDVARVRAFLDPISDDVLMMLESEHFTVRQDAQIHASGYPYLEPVQCQVFYPSRVRL